MFKSNGATYRVAIKLQAKAFSPVTNAITSPPVTFAYRVSGVIMIFRVAIDIGAGAPHRSGRGGESVEAQAANRTVVTASE